MVLSALAVMTAVPVCASAFAEQVGRFLHGGDALNSAPNVARAADQHRRRPEFAAAAWLAPLPPESHSSASATVSPGGMPLRITTSMWCCRQRRGPCFNPNRCQGQDFELLPHSLNLGNRQQSARCQTLDLVGRYARRVHRSCLFCRIGEIGINMTPPDIASAVSVVSGRADRARSSVWITVSRNRKQASSERTPPTRQPRLFQIIASYRRQSSARTAVRRRWRRR